jgi:hypothetical protein
MLSLTCHEYICEPEQRASVARGALGEDSEWSACLGTNVLDRSRYGRRRAAIRGDLSCREYDFEERRCTEAENLLARSC